MQEAVKTTIEVKCPHCHSHYGEVAFVKSQRTTLVLCDTCSSHFVISTMVKVTTDSRAYPVPAHYSLEMKKGM